MDTPEGDEPIELVVPGEYYFRNGSHYLRYEEMMEDHGDTTIIYTTPFGTLEMGISATNLELKESDSHIDMRVNYSLDMNQEHVADCCLDIHAQPKNAAGFVL